MGGRAQNSEYFEDVIYGLSLGAGSNRGWPDAAPRVWLEVFGLLGQNQAEEGVPSPEAQDAVA